MHGTMNVKNYIFHFVWRWLLRCFLHLAHLLLFPPFWFTWILTAWMKTHMCLCYPDQTERMIDYSPIMKPCVKFNGRFFLSSSNSPFSSATVLCWPWLPKCSTSIPDGLWLLPACVWFQLHLHLIKNPPSIFYGWPSFTFHFHCCCCDLLCHSLVLYGLAG